MRVIDRGSVNDEEGKVKRRIFFFAKFLHGFLHKVILPQNSPLVAEVLLQAMASTPASNVLEVILLQRHEVEECGLGGSFPTLLSRHSPKFPLTTPFEKCH